MEQQFDQSELSETVESRILGVAEKIIEDEEAKRKEELVSLLLFLSLSLSLSLSLHLISVHPSSRSER
jgi:hypothetical protein